MQPIALAAVRPRSRSAESHEAFPVVEAVQKHPPRQAFPVVEAVLKHPPRQAFPAVEAVLKHLPRQALRDSGASLVEMENTIIARIDKNIERKIAAVVKQTIGSDAEYSRMTDHVYGSLYDRLILEKERLG